MMCGLLIGALVLFGVAKMIGCGRRWHYARHGYGYGCGWRGGHGGDSNFGGDDGGGGEGRHHHHHGRRRGRGGFGGFGGGFRGFGKRYFLRWLFERLDTTPGQEKVIKEAFDEIRAAGSEARSEWHKSRAQVANAM